MTVPRCRARPVRTLSGASTWTVCDAAGLPIEPIDEYLHWLRARRCSTNTIRSYSQHLAALFTWFDARALDWAEVEFENLTDFVVAYRGGLPPLPRRGGGSRKDASIKAAAAAIREFYDYQRIENGRGPKSLRLSRVVTRGGKANPHHFMAHVERRRDAVEVNRLSAGLPAQERSIRIIDFEADFAKLLAACTSYRDQLLLSALYDLGLRIGGATGLRNGDLDVRRRQVTVTRREDNPNGALSKRQGSFVVHEGHRRFFELYREYLLREVLPAGVESDFVFVNLRPPVGRPLSYSNVYKLCDAIGERAGLGKVNPHMLRHTHATALAKAGWTNAEIAARLGQKHPSSADIYIHLANDDIEQRLAATQHLIWAGTSQAVP